eukprot:930738-Lingulodinium_polyedra.AAC.1
MHRVCICGRAVAAGGCTLCACAGREVAKQHLREAPQAGRVFKVHGARSLQVRCVPTCDTILNVGQIPLTAALGQAVGDHELVAGFSRELAL